MEKNKTSVLVHFLLSLLLCYFLNKQIYWLTMLLIFKMIKACVLPKNILCVATSSEKPLSFIMILPSFSEKSESSSQADLFNTFFCKWLGSAGMQIWGQEVWYLSAAAEISSNVEHMGLPTGHVKWDSTRWDTETFCSSSFSWDSYSWLHPTCSALDISGWGRVLIWRTDAARGLFNSGHCGQCYPGN